MTAQQLEELGDGLSIIACGRTLVTDRTRVRDASDGHDVSFVIAGTDLAPRFHLSSSQLASADGEYLSSVFRRIVVRVACLGQS